MGSRRENASRQLQGERRKVFSVLEQAQKKCHLENADGWESWAWNQHSVHGHGSEQLSGQILKDHSLTRSSRATWFHFALFSPALPLIGCLLSPVMSKRAPAPSCPKIIFFYRCVDSQLITSREGLWLSLSAEGLSKRYNNAITQPLTLPLPEQTQPSPSGLTNQVQGLTCIMFRFKPAITLVLNLSLVFLVS